MHTSDHDFCVLHALRLRGIAAPDAVEAMTAGIDGLDAKARLSALAEAGLLREIARVGGFSVSKDGRARHAELLAADREAGDLPTVLKAPYERFLTANQPFIDLCSDWQIRRDTGEANDHEDADYDAGILAQLEDPHAVGVEVAEEAAAAVERFASYAPRFEIAIEKVRAGELGWFTKPQIDSVHTIWFELHEDLLLSQDIERGEGR